MGQVSRRRRSVNAYPIDHRKHADAHERYAAGRRIRHPRRPRQQGSATDQLAVAREDEAEEIVVLLLGVDHERGRRLAQRGQQVREEHHRDREPVADADRR